MYVSKSRMWLAFSLWLAGAFLFGFVDHLRISTVFLPIYSVVAAVIVVLATRKYRPPNYRFEILGPGKVSSPLGFEVRASDSSLQYLENDRVISWQSNPVSTSLRKFEISEQGIAGWDAPHVDEPMSSKKKQQVATAVVSALLYLQLVEAGKIRSKKQPS